MLGLGGSPSRQAGQVEISARTPEFEPLKGCRIPKSPLQADVESASEPARGAIIEPRRMAPRRDLQRPTLAQDDVSCQVVQRPQGEARVLAAPQHQAHEPPQEVVVRVHQDHVPPPRRPPVATTGCRAFTPELCNIV